MGIGKETLKRAFEEISRRDHMTRKELAETIGISEVSAGRAVDSLEGAGLVSLSKGRSNSRASEVVSVSKSRLCLLIDLCDREARFAVTPPTAAVDVIHPLPFLYMRDLDANLSIALSGIVKYLNANEICPDIIAVATPTVAGSPSPEDFATALAECGLHDAFTSSGADAARRYLKSVVGDGESFAFLSIGSVIWGCSSAEPSRMAHWGRLKASAHHGESLENLLAYDTDEEHLKIYLERALSSISTVLSTDRLFVSSSFLPDNVMRAIDKLPIAETVSASDPVMNGLLRIAKDRLFEKFVLNS